MMRRACLWFACVLAVGSPLAVQSLSAQALPSQRQQLETRVRRAFQNRVRQDLQLTQPEVQRLTEVIRWSEGERRGIARRTRDLDARAVGFLRDGGTDADAHAILEARMVLQNEEAELFAEEQDRLLSVLSANQVVRFYRLRDQLNRQLQQARARRGVNE